MLEGWSPRVVVVFFAMLQEVDGRKLRGGHFVR